MLLIYMMIAISFESLRALIFTFRVWKAMIMAKICRSPLYAYEMDSHTIADLLIHTKMKLLKLFPFTCTKFNHVHKT